MRNHQVIDGVALWVDADSSNRWIDVRSCNERRSDPVLTAHLYAQCNVPGEPRDSDRFWAVRINEYGGRNALPNLNERWYGGKVLGLFERWGYEQAQAVAQSWMTSDGDFSKIIHPAVAAETA